MKIAVVGTKNMKSMIEGLIDELPEVGFIYCCTEYFDEAARIAEDIQKKKISGCHTFFRPYCIQPCKKAGDACDTLGISSPQQSSGISDVSLRNGGISQ